MQDLGYGFPRRLQAVEKVADGPIGGPEAGSKRPKTGLSVSEKGSEKGTKEFFNSLGFLSEGG